MKRGQKALKGPPPFLKANDLLLTIFRLAQEVAVMLLHSGAKRREPRALNFYLSNKV